MNWQILDTSIREGEQTAGVAFDIADKVELARLLDEFGVSYIEAGHPLVSPKIKEAVTRIAKAGLHAEVVAHVRARKEEVDQAIDCGVGRIAIFLATSDIHLQYKLGFSKEEALEAAVETVRHARKQGVNVRFTPEDGTRTNYEYLVKIANAAIGAGADHISIADTLGIAEPERFGALVASLKRDLLPCDLELHCHNDLGLAVGNALAGLKNGALVVHTTVNGLGERSGIVDMASMATAMRVLGYDQGGKLKLEMLPRISSFMEKISGVYMAANQPIVGENAFSHKSGVHTDGVLKNPSTYEGFDPSLVGRQRTIIVDRYTGKRAVQKKLDDYNISVTPEQLMQIVMEIKDLGDRNKKVHDADIINLAEKVTGKVVVKIPESIEALVLLKTESHVYTTFVLKRLSNFAGVERVFEITGDHDISALVKAGNIQDLNNLLEEIRNIRGVQSTDTTIILKKFEKQH